jgi:hypothetical protein
VDETRLTRELNERCVDHLEIHPNRIVFHDTDEIRELQGVGRLLKEQKLVDHRPQTPAPARPAGGTVLSTIGSHGQPSRPGAAVPGSQLEHSS